MGEPRARTSVEPSQKNLRGRSRVGLGYRQVVSWDTRLEGAIWGGLVVELVEEMLKTWWMILNLFAAEQYTEARKRRLVACE